MIKQLARLFTVALLLFPALLLSATESKSAVDARPLYTFYTGSERGTYFQFASDIERACPQFHVQVVATNGSLDNLNQLIQESAMVTGSRFAFVQQDAYRSVIATEPRAALLLKHVTTLYNEDIVILVNKESKIKDLHGLIGKRVAVGMLGSGNWFTGAEIRKVLGLSWIQIQHSPEQSLLEVLTGEIDAMVYVGGRPTKLLNEMSAHQRAELQILDLSEPELNKLYKKITLPAKTYPWQEQSVQIRTVPSELVAASDVTDNSRDSLLQCIADSKTALNSWGHPRWQDVKLAPQKMKQL